MPRGVKRGRDAGVYFVVHCVLYPYAFARRVLDACPWGVMQMVATTRWQALVV
jgi:hypothetical protein